MAISFAADYRAKRGDLRAGDCVLVKKKKARKERPEHLRGAAYGCSVSRLTRFTVSHCRAPPPRACGRNYMSTSSQRKGGRDDLRSTAETQAEIHPIIGSAFGELRSSGVGRRIRCPRSGPVRGKSFSDPYCVERVFLENDS